jgi:surface antigen
MSWFEGCRAGTGGQENDRSSGPGAGQPYKESPQVSEVEQLPFPETSPSYLLHAPASGPPTLTQLVTPHTSPERSVAQVRARPAPPGGPPAPTRRFPLVIHRSAGRASVSPSPRPAAPRRRRRWPVQLATLGVVILMLLITLMAALPTGSGPGRSIFNPLRSVIDLIRSSQQNSYQLGPQAATATAVTRDGYDNGPLHYAGLPPQPATGDLNRFAYGQCTYWANMRYHQLTGYWVPWQGDAYQWVAGAQAYGWIVSARPRVPSIIVLQPGVQGASAYGHVAVVERINPDGSVYTSNYNWYANGGWNRLSYVTFHPGRGVAFVWHP